MDILKYINGCEYFGGLTQQQMERVSSISRVEDVHRRDLLFMEDAKGHSIYLLLEGSIQLSKLTAEGREIVIRTVKPGEMFAEVILFEKDRYPVTATAILESKVLTLLKADFLSLLDERSFRDGFLRSLMQKQRYLAERVRYIAAYDVEERLIKFLHEQYGPVEKMSVPLSKKDIAAAIGTIPETLSRLLQRLEKRKVLTWNGSEIQFSKGFWDDFVDESS